jgi:hypothetical protein
MSQNNIFLNVPGGDKSILIRRNKKMGLSLEPICQDFRDNLVNDIAQANGSELMHRRSTQLLGNKSNKSMILFFKKSIISKKIPNTRKDHIFDNTPIFLIKKSSEAIRTQSFCRSQC